MKTFTITIQDGQGTRWQADDQQLRAGIKTLIDSLARIHTTGPEPRVIVSQDEPRCEICAEREAAKIVPVRVLQVFWCAQCHVERVHGPGIRCVKCSQLPPVANEAQPAKTQLG